jgi:hypothetical protein
MISVAGTCRDDKAKEDRVTDKQTLEGADNCAA